MSTKYTVDYFIKKFSKIPSKKWTDSGYYVDEDGRCCALGHCGFRENCADEKDTQTGEGKALIRLFKTRLLDVATINDAFDFDSLSRGPTPRARILNTLKSFKK